MKKLYSLLLLGGLLLFGVQSVEAADVCKNTHIYFDNTISEWGGDGYNYYYFDINDTHGWKFSAITNTTLFHHERTDNTWGSYNYVRIVAFSGDWSEGQVLNNYSNIYNNCTNMTNTYNNFGFSTNYAYYIRPDKTGTKDNQANLAVGTIGGNTYAALNNCAQTVGIKVADHTGVYSVPTTATAALSGTGYTFSNWTTCGTTANGSVTAGSTTTTMSVGGGYRAKVVLSYSDVASGYEFVGWYDNSGNLLSSSASYTYYPNASGNVFAYFRPNSFSKTITAAGWATYCCPFAIDLSTATNLTDAFIVTGGTDGVLTKTSVKSETVPANTGLLLKGTEGSAVTVTIPVVASSETNVSTNKLTGVTVATEIAANGGYVLMNDATNGLAFYQNSNAFTVGANTAYLPASFASSAPSMFRLEDEENNATDIHSIEANEKAVKFIENGKLLIRKDGVVYDMTGRIIR
ncbi:MAG: hypothetical protein E7074_08775 [Bacteroidales bacterium]|jgi:hypothetical protein|nr:hypothetical protein [Bacteroidales bacterium]